MVKGWRAKLTAIAALSFAFTGVLTHVSASALTPAATSSAESTPNAVGLLAYNNATLDATTNLDRYDVVVINAFQYDQIPMIRAANPNAIILVYKNIAATETYDVVNGVDNPLLPTGVGWAWANANHPDWFLQDTNGNRVQWADYSQRWWMDVGNPAYQNTWASNVISEAKQYGVNGVLLDDVDMSEAGHLPAGTTLAKYPTDSDYAAATQSFLANVGPQLQNAGLLAVANIAFPWTPNWEPAYKSWLGDVSGVMLEHWMKPGQDSSYARYGNGDWTYQMQQAADVMDAGKMFLPLTYGDPGDTTTQEYARASFLMSWNGGNSSLLWVPDGTGINTWSSRWTTDLGLPAGPAQQLPSGVWERRYAGGLVLVNPSTTASVSVDTGASYLTPSGASVTSVRLAPTTGAVLTSGGKPSGQSTTRKRSAGLVGKALRSLSWRSIRTEFHRWAAHPSARHQPRWQWRRLRGYFFGWRHANQHARVSFYRWRRAHGLSGRRVLDRLLGRRFAAA